MEYYAQITQAFPFISCCQTPYIQVSAVSECAVHGSLLACAAAAASESRGLAMQHHYVNRACRVDRNHLWRGAMAAQGVQLHEMRRHVAMDKDDYTDAASICEAARVEFPEFFGFHLESPQPHIGFGHLICSWSVMRMWREIAAGRNIACAWLDDYALRVPVVHFNALYSAIAPDVLLLAWHARPDLYIERRYVRRQWNVPSALFPEQTRVHTNAVYRGTMGSSDWAVVLTPQGAGAVLDYMASEPLLNTEFAIGGMAADGVGTEVWSVVASNRYSTGLKPIYGNHWVMDLGSFAEGAFSDLVGTHHQGPPLAEVSNG